MATIPSTATAGRIVTLDVIRGVAVMGIFSVNIIAFAMIEAAYFNPAAYGGHKGWDLFVWAANMVLIDGKMRSLFSMLFGASMLLVIERAEAAGESGWWTHFRRMIVLLGFGLIHYYFIWFGDILTLYAICGLIVFLFRKMSVEKQAALGAAFIIGHMLLFGGLMAQMYQADLAAHAANATPDAIEEWNEGLGFFYADPAAIALDRLVHSGSWLNFVQHRLSDWTDIIPSTAPFIPDTIGLMLLGMAGYRSGFLTGEWDDGTYRRVAIWGLALGALCGIGIVAYDVASNFYIVGMMTAFGVIATPFHTVMAIGYAALIILVSRGLGPLARRIAAAGRSAFTNYLGTSLLATFIFYGWGLGYYAKLSRAEAWLLVPLFWTIMLLWSKPWLDRFAYGPFEWVWRSLSRGKLQPMSKGKPQTAAAGA